MCDDFGSSNSCGGDDTSTSVCDIDLPFHTSSSWSSTTSKSYSPSSRRSKQKSGAAKPRNERSKHVKYQFGVMTNTVEAKDVDSWNKFWNSNTSKAEQVSTQNGATAQTESSRRDDTLEHGFSFGERSISCQPLPSSHAQNDGVTYDGWTGEEDEGIGEIYSTDGLDFGSDNDSPIFRRYARGSHRHVLSQRIGDVGAVGQNLGLGHLVGIMAEDSELRPKAVQVETYQLIITEDSPTQIDIRWLKPDNLSTFKSFSYELEIMTSDEETWSELTSVRQEVFRVYHTDQKLMVGKKRFKRRSGDFWVSLRIRCAGDIVLSDCRQQTLKSKWSRDVSLTFVGYDTGTGEKQVTSL